MDLHVVEILYYNGDRAARAIREPAAFREDGIYDVLGGEITVVAPELPDSERSGDRITDLGRMCGTVADAVAEGLRAGRRVFVTGGNCSHLPGVVGGLQQALGPTERIGLVWFDAHGDFNTPRTTLSGMLGGMPVAVVAGLCYPDWRAASKQVVPMPTDRIVMVDVRNLDPEEERLIRATDVEVVRDPEALSAAMERLAAETDYIYLHIDHDILDESLTPTHPTKEPNGLDVAQTLALVDTVLATGKVGTIALVSINADGPGGDTTLASAKEMLRGTLARWQAAG